MRRRVLLKGFGGLGAACLSAQTWGQTDSRSSNRNNTFAPPTWSTAAPLPISIQEIYPTLWQNQVVVAGGIAARMSVPYFTDATLSFHPSSNTWRNLATLPEPLHHLALVDYNNTLLGIGGFNGAYTHVWRMRQNVYQLSDNGWEPHSKLPTPQAEGVVGVYNNRVHVVTGQQPRGQANRKRQDHQESTLHWVLDGNRWTSAQPIPTPRNSASGGWIGDQLVVAGGRTARGNLTQTEIYDAKSDTWRSGRPMPLAQAGTAGATDSEHLYVFGGEIFVPEAGVFKEVWRYHLASDTWTPLPDMLTPRHGIGAVRVGRQIHVIGGAIEPGGSGTSDLNEVLSL